MSRFSFALPLLLLLSLSGALQAATLSPDVVERAAAALSTGERIPVILTFREKVDLSSYRHGRESAGDMILDLKETAARSQDRVLALLRERGLGEVKSFWIQNNVAVAVTPSLLEELAGFPEVEAIDYDAPGGAPEPDREPVGERVTFWNMDMIRAPEIWSTYGLDGTGIVVGSMDTGIDINHPALQGRWRGGNNSWLDVINALPDPYDDHGHGSHTIGTMVGGDGAGPFGSDIGLAYNARVISAKVLDSNNSFSSASIVIAGAQWMLDPDGDPQTDDFPHVINNSWYFFNQTYAGFHGSVEAWRAAGIIPVFSIGNFGPGAATTRAPANYNNTIGVGATDASDLIASFSSRGPSPAGAAFPADQRKPELSAPGESVRSSLPGGGYGDWSGTSMAAPHVAATAALMIELLPSLTYDEIRQILLETSVDLGAAGYDFDYGYGRLDAFEAITRVVATLTVADPTAAVPAGLRLIAGPNPFRDRVWLEFEAGEGTTPMLSIFDVGGRLVRAFQVASDSPSLSWDGRDERGRAVAQGVYLARLSAGGEAATRRLLRVR